MFPPPLLCDAEPPLDVCAGCGAGRLGGGAGAGAGFDLSLSLSPNAWIEDEMAKRKAANRIHLLKLFRFECM
jgi:hypothetical protein